MQGTPVACKTITSCKHNQSDETMFLLSDALLAAKVQRACNVNFQDEEK